MNAEPKLTDEQLKLIRKSGKLALILGWLQLALLPVVAYLPKLYQPNISQEDFVNQATIGVALGLFVGVFLIVKSRPLRRAESYDPLEIDKEITGIIVLLLLVALALLLSGGHIAWLQILLAGWLVRSKKAIRSLKLPSVERSERELVLMQVRSAGKVALWVALSQASALVLDLGQLLVPPIDQGLSLAIDIVFAVLVNVVFGGALVFVGRSLLKATESTLSKAQISLWVLIAASVVYTALNIFLGTYLAPVPYFALLFFLIKAVSRLRGGHQKSEVVEIS